MSSDIIKAPRVSRGDYLLTKNLLSEEGIQSPHTSAILGTEAFVRCCDAFLTSLAFHFYHLLFKVRFRFYPIIHFTMTTTVIGLLVAMGVTKVRFGKILKTAIFKNRLFWQNLWLNVAQSGGLDTVEKPITYNI